MSEPGGSPPLLKLEIHASVYSRGWDVATAVDAHIKQGDVHYPPGGDLSYCEVEVAPTLPDPTALTIVVKSPRKSKIKFSQKLYRLSVRPDGSLELTLMEKEPRTCPQPDKTEVVPTTLAETLGSREAIRDQLKKYLGQTFPNPTEFE